MNSNIEIALEQKFKDSYIQIEKERKSSGLLACIEMVLVVAAIVCFLFLVKFIFWGPGFSWFATAQHDYSVSVLMDMPGPHREMVEMDVVENGYISLSNYRKYVDMANAHKLVNMPLPVGTN